MDQITPSSIIHETDMINNIARALPLDFFFMPGCFTISRKSGTAYIWKMVNEVFERNLIPRNDASPANVSSVKKETTDYFKKLTYYTCVFTVDKVSSNATPINHSSTVNKGGVVLASIVNVVIESFMRCEILNSQFVCDFQLLLILADASNAAAAVVKESAFYKSLHDVISKQKTIVNISYVQNIMLKLKNDGIAYKIYNEYLSARNSRAYAQNVVVEICLGISGAIRSGKKIAYSGENALILADVVEHAEYLYSEYAEFRGLF